MTTVYVVEGGEYESTYLVGVYDSPERAIGILGGQWTRMLSGRREKGTVRYTEEWLSNIGTHSWLRMWPEEVVTEGTEADPLATAIVVTKPGGTLRHPITKTEADAFINSVNG